MLYGLDHSLSDMNSSKRMLYPFMGRASIHNIGLPELVDPTEPLECRMVNNPHLLGIKPHKPADWQEELLSLFLAGAASPRVDLGA